MVRLGAMSLDRARIDASEEDIAAATAYENLHVPALFRQWAPRVIDAAGIAEGDRVLDVACGTGVLAREARVRTNAVDGVDASPGMLTVAEQLEPAVRWKQGLAESLPYPEASFDAVVSQFGLMFFENREGALAEMLRVLRPGGRLAVAVWESLENSEAYPIEVALLGRLAGPEAANALRAPFVLGDRNELRALFLKAGADSVEIRTHEGRARFPDIRTMVEADLRGWLPVMGVHLTEEQISRILDEAGRVLSSYVTDDGSVEFASPAHIVSGSRP